MTLFADVTDEPLFVGTRRVLMDTLETLGSHRRAVILVGAQAVYLRTQHVRLPASIFTRDADLGIDPARLDAAPELVTLLASAAIEPHPNGQPGAFIRHISLSDGRDVGIEIDLMVAAAVAPGAASRRSVTLPDHGKMAFRRTPGLEASLVDSHHMTIRGVGDDPRSFDILVAGIPALMIAKAYKLMDRINRDDVEAKDAGDVYRMALAIRRSELTEVRDTFRRLSSHPVIGEPTTTGISHLRALFGRPRSSGVLLAQQALATQPAAPIAGLLTTFMEATLPPDA